jgi:hypothetical protein
MDNIENDLLKMAAALDPRKVVVFIDEFNEVEPPACAASLTVAVELDQVSFHKQVGTD